MIRLLQRLLGITPAEPTQSFRGVVNGVEYDVRPVDGKFAAVSIDLPRHQLSIAPIEIQNDRHDDETRTPRPGASGRMVDALFHMRAASVDLCSRGNSLAAHFRQGHVTVDKALAEQVVAMLIQLRDDVTDAQRAIVPPKYDGQPAVSASVDIDGQTILFDLSPCLIITDEDAGMLGNLDLTVQTNPPLTAQMLEEHVRLAVPGHDELLQAPGYSPIDRGAELGFTLIELAASLGFHADQKRQQWLWEMVTTLKQVDVVWEAGDHRIAIATVPCFIQPVDDGE